MGSEVPVRASSALPAPQAATEAAALRSGSARTPPPRGRSGSAVKACDSLSRRCVRARRSAALCLHGAFPFACALVLTPPSALRAPSRSLRRSLPFSPYFLHLPSARLGQVEGAFEGEGSRGWEQSRRGGRQKTTRPRAWAMCPMEGAGATGGAEAGSPTRLHRSARPGRARRGCALASVWLRGRAARVPPRRTADDNVPNNYLALMLRSQWESTGHGDRGQSPKPKLLPLSAQAGPSPRMPSEGSDQSPAKGR